jgi:hypothetical protein
LVVYPEPVEQDDPNADHQWQGNQRAQAVPPMSFHRDRTRGEVPGLTFPFLFPFWVVGQFETDRRWSVAPKDRPMNNFGELK